MLNNFIYAKTKDLFLKELEAGNVLDEAIVFIEDTKEIWNHGTYFDGKSVDISDIEESINNILNNKGVIQAVDTSEELDDIETNTYVKYVAQTLTDALKLQVRENIGVGENLDLSGYATKDDLNNKQDKLVSGTNIKKIHTIDGTDDSILGSGDLYLATMNMSTSKVVATGILNNYDVINISIAGLEFIPEEEGPDAFRWSIHKNGDGTQFLSDDGTYKTLYTATEIDNKIGDINTILESIING